MKKYSKPFLLQLVQKGKTCIKEYMEYENMNEENIQYTYQFGYASAQGNDQLFKMQVKEFNTIQ